MGASVVSSSQQPTLKKWYRDLLLYVQLREEFCRTRGCHRAAAGSEGSDDGKNWIDAAKDDPIQQSAHAYIAKHISNVANQERRLKRIIWFVRVVCSEYHKSKVCLVTKSGGLTPDQKNWKLQSSLHNGRTSPVTVRRWWKQECSGSVHFREA